MWLVKNSASQVYIKLIRARMKMRVPYSNHCVCPSLRLCVCPSGIWISCVYLRLCSVLGCVQPRAGNLLLFSYFAVCDCAKYTRMGHFWIWEYGSNITNSTPTFGQDKIWTSENSPQPVQNACGNSSICKFHAFAASRQFRLGQATIDAQFKI